MKDTFTNIIPLYKHEPKTCFTQTFSHIIHPEFKTNIENKPWKHESREYNHKFDQIKIYNEEMLKIKEFAPKPI